MVRAKEICTSSSSTYSPTKEKPFAPNVEVNLVWWILDATSPASLAKHNVEEQSTTSPYRGWSVWLRIWKPSLELCQFPRGCIALRPQIYQPQAMSPIVWHHSPSSPQSYRYVNPPDRVYLPTTKHETSWRFFWCDLSDHAPYEI